MILQNNDQLIATSESASFKELKEAWSDKPRIRLYCEQFNEAYNLQIYATTKIEKSLHNKSTKQHNLLATISLSKNDLKALAKYIKKEVGA